MISSMNLAELRPALSELSRPDKFRVVQFLTAELVEEESQLVEGAEFPVWSPYDAHDEATTMTRYLREQAGDS